MSAAAGAQPLGRRRLVTTAALVSLAGVLVAALFTAFGDDGSELGWDFRAAYLPAAEAVAAGDSPYRSPNDAVIDIGSVYAYPPQLALALTPFTLLPEDVAAVLAVLGCMAALAAALALLGVRDARCYAAVPLWATGWNAIEMANASALLVLLTAVAWRYRASVWPLGAALGVAAALKLFLWPLLVWAAATRRLPAAAAAVAVGLAMTAVSWAVIGFAGVTTYPELLRRISGQESYSINGMLRELGAGRGVAVPVTILVGSALVCGVVVLARRGDERRAFVLAVAAALALSPIVWLHYLVLLIVPLGIMRPLFSAIWLLPIVLWMSPRSGNGEGLEPFVPALVATAVFVLLLTRTSREHGAEVAPA